MYRLQTGEIIVNLSKKQLEKLIIDELKLISEQSEIKDIDPPETVTDPEVFNNEVNIMEHFQRLTIVIDKLWQNQQNAINRIKALEEEKST
jgi:hypothetical protein